MEKRGKNRKFFQHNFLSENRRGQYRRNNFGTFWFIIHLVVGAYFVNLGFNFVNLGFTEPIRNYVTIAGGALIIIAGFMSVSRARRTTR